jgi:hypothetical protein
MSTVWYPPEAALPTYEVEYHPQGDDDYSDRLSVAVRDFPNGTVQTVGIYADEDDGPNVVMDVGNTKLSISSSGKIVDLGRMAAQALGETEPQAAAALAVLIVVTDAPDRLLPAIATAGAEVRAMATGVSVGLGDPRGPHAMIQTNLAPDMEPHAAAEILAYVAQQFAEPAGR